MQTRELRNLEKLRRIFTMLIMVWFAIFVTTTAMTYGAGTILYNPLEMGFLLSIFSGFATLISVFFLAWTDNLKNEEKQRLCKLTA